MSVDFKKIKNYLMTGMSYMIPMTVIGGIFYAGSIAFGGTAVAGEGMVIKNEFLLHVQEIGAAGLFMMIPVLAGYIAYAIAGKPGLAPGLVAGYIANTEITIGGNAVKTGFLGALVLGFMTGYIVRYMKKIHYPDLIKTVVPILIIPVVTSFIVCIFYMYILANPIGMAMGGIESFLTSLSSGSKVVLGIIMGMMVTVDMGGPVNKTACLFSIGMMAEGHYEFFGICAVPICTAPLGMGLATLLSKNKYTQEERDAGKASLFMGLKIKHELKNSGIQIQKLISQGKLEDAEKMISSITNVNLGEDTQYVKLKHNILETIINNKLTVCGRENINIQTYDVSDIETELYGISEQEMCTIISNLSISNRRKSASRIRLSASKSNPLSFSSRERYIRYLSAIVCFTGWVAALT